MTTSYSCDLPIIRRLIGEVYDLHDGTGALRTVIECAVADDPAVTAQEIREIWAQAEADARVERAREVTP